MIWLVLFIVVSTLVGIVHYWSRLGEFTEHKEELLYMSCWAALATFLLQAGTYLLALLMIGV